MVTQPSWSPSLHTDNEPGVFAMQDVIDALPTEHLATPAIAFPRFTALSGELRALVINEYLHLERDEGGLSKRCHIDRSGMRCCVWNYPSVFIACDDQDVHKFPCASKGRLPLGWLPALAFTSSHMLGEVSCHKVKNTERFDISSTHHQTEWRIATWFKDFLGAIPGVENAITHLGFPHFQWYYQQVEHYPLRDVELMLACQNLRKVDLTIHATSLWVYTDGPWYKMLWEIQELVDKFRLKSMLECKQLREVYIDGVFGSQPGDGSYDLMMLEQLEKWMVRSFRDRGQAVRVEWSQRQDTSKGPVPRSVVEVEDEEV